jgi:micrococcal nuclease
LQGVTACIPAQEAQQATVTRIVDGDTIHVAINGQDYTVRYIGINTPEDTTKIEPFGQEATEANRALVEGKEVLLYKDVSETDRYGRLLRFVVIPGDQPVFVNYELVRRGFANPATYPPDVACAETYLEAERQAREEGLGLWAAPPPVVQPPPAEGNCDPSYPDVCIPPPPPDLDCKDVPYKRFRVLPPDPHHFDRDGDGIGCES